MFCLSYYTQYPAAISLLTCDTPNPNPPLITPTPNHPQTHLIPSRLPAVTKHVKMASAARVNKPTDIKVKEADVNRKLQVYGIINAFQNGKVPSVCCSPT